MAGLFDEIIALVTKKDLVDAQARRLNEPDESVLQGAVLSAVVVIAGMARASDRADDPWRLQDSLSTLARSSPSNNGELFGLGNDVAAWLLDDRVHEVVDHVSEQAGLRRDSAADVMAAAVARTGVYIAEYRNGPPVVTDLPIRLAEEETELVAAGWGPWIETTTPRHAENQSAGVLRTNSADVRTADRLVVEPGGRGGEHLGSAPSAQHQDKGPATGRSSRRRALAGGLVVLAIMAGALAVWRLGGQEEVASDGSESASTDPASTTTATIAPAQTSTTTTDTTESVVESTTTEPEPIPALVNYTVALGDPQDRSDAAGTLDLEIDTIAGEVCYEFDVEGIPSPYAAHIHVGPSGANGGITVDFGAELSGSSADCVDSEPADLIAAVTSSKERYVELHDLTGAFTIRGQLTDPEPGETDRAAEISIDDGAYSVISGGSIVLRGDVPDQATLEEFVASQSDDNGTITVVNELQIAEGATPPSGLVIVEGSIMFALNSTELTDAELAVLAGIAEVLQAKPSWSVTLVGHTDSSGPALYNFDLSLRRARAVRLALLDLGVPATAVTIQGDGPISPIAENDTDDGRAENRRIELVVDAGS